MRNRQLRLKRRPEGRPVDADFELIEDTVPEPGPGQVLVKNLYASIDPAMRGWMRPARTYIEPVELGDVMRALTVGQVVVSNSMDLPAGTFVSGSLGLQEFACANSAVLQVVDSSIAPLTSYCGGLGMTGHAAYFGILEVGQPKAGETVLVSSAAGATGSVAGQLRKYLVAALLELLAAARNATSCWNNWALTQRRLSMTAASPQQWRKLAPEGIDVFFDNVGGPVLDAGLLNLRRHARVVLCGAISQTEYPLQKVQGICFSSPSSMRELRASLCSNIASAFPKLRPNLLPGFKVDSYVSRSVSRLASRAFLNSLASSSMATRWANLFFRLRRMANEVLCSIRH